MANIPDTITEDKLRSWWDRLPHTDGFWSYYSGMTYDKFRKAHLSAALVVELPFGVVRVPRYSIGCPVEFHPVFWSPQVFKSLQVLEDAIKLIESATLASRLDAIVVRTHRAPEKLLTRLGFHPIETISQGFINPSGCYDAVRYARIVERGA
jgi:hypothetical protein